LLLYRPLESLTEHINDLQITFTEPKFIFETKTSHISLDS